jgi:IS605 OrfB family transposase
MKTYNIRLFPDVNQVSQLLELSSIRNNLWNTLIDIEQFEYEDNKKIVHNYELDKRITELRKNTNVSKLNSKACQRISKEVYSSYQSFFKLIQKDKTAKPPRKIEDVSKLHTIVFNQSGWIINSNEVITINKIKFKYKSHLDITKLDIKEIRIKFINNKWICDICVNDNVVYDDIIQQDNKVLAIDLGLKRLGTGVDNKGKVIVIKNKSKKISKYYLKQISKVQNKLSNTNKGSKRNDKLKLVLNKLYNKKNKQVKQTLHTQSKELLSMNYKCIVIGDLSVKKLMSSGDGKYNGLNKSFHQSNISMFVDMLKYKSYMFKTDIIKINEAYTTQLNCLTGKQFKDKITLSDRSVKLSNDIEIDRDLNASINILERYFNNHLAAMTQPLDKSNVIHRFNLMNKSSLIEKPMVL